MSMRPDLRRASTSLAAKLHRRSKASLSLRTSSATLRSCRQRICTTPGLIRLRRSSVAEVRRQGAAARVVSRGETLSLAATRSNRAQQSSSKKCIITRQDDDQPTDTRRFTPRQPCCSGRPRTLALVMRLASTCRQDQGVVGRKDRLFSVLPEHICFRHRHPPVPDIPMSVDHP